MASRPIQQKIAALAACEMSGSATEAAHMLGLPDRTVRDWKQRGVQGDMEMGKAIEDTVKLVRPEMIEQAAKIVTTAAGIVAEQLVKIRDRKDWEPKPSELRDITWCGGVWLDKWKVLVADQTGTPTPQTPVSPRDNPLLLLVPSPEQAKTGESA